MLSTVNTAPSNPVSPNLVLIDPMTMHRPFAQSATGRSQSAAHPAQDNNLFAGNPFAIASPFCNPDV